MVKKIETNNEKIDHYLELICEYLSLDRLPKEFETQIITDALQSVSNNLKNVRKGRDTKDVLRAIKYFPFKKFEDENLEKILNILIETFKEGDTNAVEIALDIIPYLPL